MYTITALFSGNEGTFSYYSTMPLYALDATLFISMYMHACLKLFYIIIIIIILVLYRLCIFNLISFVIQIFILN